VTNDGDRRATDIVVTVRAADGTLILGPSAAAQTMQSISVADLRAGDTETVDIEVAAARVDPGTYPLFAGVQYRIDAESTDDEDDLDETDETNDDEGDRDRPDRRSDATRDRGQRVPVFRCDSRKRQRARRRGERLRGSN